jgi:hypothetical protein
MDKIRADKAGSAGNQYFHRSNYNFLGATLKRPWLYLIFAILFS